MTWEKTLSIAKKWLNQSESNSRGIMKQSEVARILGGVTLIRIIIIFNL